MAGEPFRYEIVDAPDGERAIRMRTDDEVIAHLAGILREARAELDKHGYGDFHYTAPGWRDPDVLAMLTKIDGELGD